MHRRDKQRSVEVWGDQTVAPGTVRNIRLEISASYSGITVSIPIQVCRGVQEGPTVFVTAAVHGDEINGTGAVRELICDDALKIDSGSLILVPVVNVLGFERHSRYLPDRRDLNRSFPGNSKGSLASRMARVIFDEIVGRSDCGIDLHSASVRRTNFPNTRGDFSNPEVRKLAETFGCEVSVNERGPAGCLRRAACDAGCPTFILEAGEVWKMESSVIEYAVRGIRNVLVSLEMIEGDRQEPSYRTVIDTTKWLRADTPGFLQFHVAPGDIVSKGAPIATITSLFGKMGEVIASPEHGIILGMTTLPVTAPGEPVVHVGILPKDRRRLEKIVDGLDEGTLHERVREDLSSGIRIVDPEQK